MPAKILAYAGSSRAGSFNRKLIRIAADAARAAGGDVTLVELSDYEMPLYNGDLESSAGLPEKAKAMKAPFLSHDGLLFSCPEYNSSITPLWKNTIDWVSRPAPGEKNLECFEGKVAGLVAASPGALGGLRGLVHVRSILGNIGVFVIPKQVAVMKAHEAFDENGALKDAKQTASVGGVAQQLVKTVEALGRK